MYLVSLTCSFYDSSVEPQILHFIFHTVKNWYQFLTAREKMVPICQIYRTNNSYYVKNTHGVKFYIVSHIDKTYPQHLLHFASDSNASQRSVSIKYQFFVRMRIRYLFTCVRIWYQFFTRVSLRPFFHICENLIPILHIVLNLHITR